MFGKQLMIYFKKMKNTMMMVIIVIMKNTKLNLNNFEKKDFH